MKIFLSWSGARSHAVALIFNDWLPSVLQSVIPWISSEHIVKGASWLSEIKEAISASNGMGVFFLTPEALHSSWMLFEAGGVAALGDKRVCTVLVDLDSEAVAGAAPWNTFQGTRLDRNDLFKLVKDINARLETPLAAQVLEKVFDRAWPELDGQLNSALAGAQAEPAGPAKRGTEEPGALAGRVESMSQAMQGVEARLGRLEEETQKANSQITNGLATLSNQLQLVIYQPTPQPGLGRMETVARNLGAHLTPVVNALATPLPLATGANALAPSVGERLRSGRKDQNK